MKINELTDWICTLEEQKKLKEMQVHDLSWKIRRMEEYDEAERQIAINCIVHEIRRLIEPKLETFKDIYEGRNGNTVPTSATKGRETKKTPQRNKRR